jgi:hypothetical protein
MLSLTTLASSGRSTSRKTDSPHRCWTSQRQNPREQLLGYDTCIDSPRCNVGKLASMRLLPTLLKRARAHSDVSNFAAQLWSILAAISLW